MKTDYILPALLSLSLATARPFSTVQKREVPQEHSHEQFLSKVRTSLNLNNPAGIVDPVFGLLGNAAAAGGKGKIADVECLQQATADQAFTNAKAAKDVAGMTAALIYRALERNTGKVGLKSNPCTSIKAVNPEIAAIQQHQDPASAEAAAGNKAIALALAKQIASIGGNPQDALKSGTFAPGSLADNSGKGNTCDVANDPTGCIFTQNLLVSDATAAEIAAAAGGAAAPAPAPAPAPVPTPAPTSAANCPAPASSSTPTTPVVVNPAINLGSCSNPTIVFGPGFDGRKENSFEPANKASFNHGSAQNIGVITSFICGQLGPQCKASATASAACAKGSTAASKLTGQAAADAFNAAFA